MSSFRADGLDELVAQLNGYKDAYEKAAPAMLEAGGKVVVEKWRQAIRKHGLVDTGDMLNSVRAEPMKSNKYKMAIYPRGLDRKGAPNAAKAFTNHYGSSTRKATHFVDDAEKEAEGPAIDAMAKVWNDYLENGG